MNRKQAQLNTEGHVIVGSQGTSRTNRTFKLIQEPPKQKPEYFT